MSMNVSNSMHNEAPIMESDAMNEMLCDWFPCTRDGDKGCCKHEQLRQEATTPIYKGSHLSR
eukprot:c45997_g1_i1 orf=2-184(-)